uniref:Uncharacterized protein n=1 Tax=Oryza glaberrima TaxID=4538 RepID=A0A679BBP6_ORYGL|nr:hypothetical protein [Oryza glaberrima]
MSGRRTSSRYFAGVCCRNVVNVAKSCPTEEVSSESSEMLLSLLSLHQPNTPSCDEDCHIARGAMALPSPESLCQSSRRPSSAVLPSSSRRGVVGARDILAWPVARPLPHSAFIGARRYPPRALSSSPAAPSPTSSSCRRVLRIIKTAGNVVKLPSSPSP